MGFHIRSLESEWIVSGNGSRRHREDVLKKEARDPSPLSLSNCPVFKSLRLRRGSSSSVTGAVWSTDLWLMEGGAGEVGGCWKAGTFQSGQQFFITAFLAQSCCRAGRRGLKAARSWISFSPSSFPLAFSYLSV